MDTPIRPYGGPLPFIRAKWHYTRLHIPSGTRTQDTTQETTFVAFLFELDCWNREQPGMWQYLWTGERDYA